MGDGSKIVKTKKKHLWRDAQPFTSVYELFWCSPVYRGVCLQPRRKIESYQINGTLLIHLFGVVARQQIEDFTNLQIFTGHEYLKQVRILHSLANCERDTISFWALALISFLHMSLGAHLSYSA